MRRITINCVAVTALACVLAAVPAPAIGQEVIHHVYRNAASVRDLIREVGKDSKEFRATFERHYNEMFVSNWRRSDASRKAMQRMDEALERVNRRQSNGEKPKYLRDDVRKVVERATEFDRMFGHPDDVLATMRGDWPSLKSGIDDLAASYNLPGVGD